MKESRKQVFAVIDRERDFQDEIVSPVKQTVEHSVGDHLVMLQHYVTLAMQEWTTKRGIEAALHEVRKIAALAVRCMEQHGAPERQKQC